MKAMIFAAGLGSRLKPLTDTKPKALIEVAGKPMLEHVILKLKASGFTEIVINVHHFADQILDFLQANHNFGVDIHISDETEELLDTGGGLEKAGKYFISPCHEDKNGILLHNVDILSNCNLQDLIRFHQQTPDVYATMLVSRRITSRYLLLKYEEGKYREYAYSGIQAINPLLLNKGMKPGKYSIIDFYLQVCKNIRIQGYPVDNLQLIDIGKPETLIKAEEFLNQL